MRSLSSARRIVPLLVTITAAAVLALPPTSALADTNIISSSGPLTDIFTSDSLNCQVQSTGDSGGQFYNATYTDPSCGTFVAFGGTLYTPQDAGSGPTQTAYTPVSQTGPTGTGTSGDPYVIVTVVDLPSSNLEITQTDSYVEGQDSYQTDIQISNSSESTASGTVYRAGDCYLDGHDAGYGQVDSGTGAVACSTGTGSGARLLRWTPLTAGSHYTEGRYDAVWSQVTSAANSFNDSCDCSTSEDNGSGLSWSFDIPAGSSSTFSETLGLTPAATCSASPPDAPTNVHAFAGNASAAVSWSAPDNDGGDPVQSYTVNIYDESGGGGFAPVHADSVQTTDTSTVVDGLNNGDTYHFTVQATNCAGTGPESDPSESVTPSADSSAQTIGPGQLTQQTGDTPKPTTGDTTIGVQQFPAGTTGVGTLEELDAGGGTLAVHGAVPLGQFCGGSSCIGNVLEAKLHDGSLGGPFYKLKLLYDRTIVRHLRLAVKVWYDGNLADDDTAGGDPTPPIQLSPCSGTFDGTPCIARISRVAGYDLKVVVKTEDIDPRLSTSK